MGFFVSLEGGEGTGKTTQAKLLCDRLAAHGHRVVAVREPGGTDLGAYLRSYLKATSKPLTPEAELFLFVAARSELVRRVIRPAMEAGSVVVADRYADSTTAYQGYGRRVPLRYIRNANELATGGLWPDITVLFDAPLDVALNRARTQGSLREEHQEPAGLDRAAESDKQRFERIGASFHRRVGAAYLKLAVQEPQRWVVLDAAQPAESLAELVWRHVAERLDARSVSPTGAGRLPGL